MFPSFDIAVQFSSVSQSCLTLCDPMDCCTPDFAAHHQLPELTQTSDVCACFIVVLKSSAEVIPQTTRTSNNDPG